MTHQQLRKKTEGFTIIEVLIVLAIAGLILLIVFLAVPALQRNSRNTQLRNDASVILGYVNDYSANNNGAVPVDVCYDAATGNVGMHDAANGCSASTHLVGKIRAGLTADNGTANPTATGSLIVGLNRKCNGDTIATATSSRAVAVGFQVETAGTPQNQCVEG